MIEAKSHKLSPGDRVTSTGQGGTAGKADRHGLIVALVPANAVTGETHMMCYVLFDDGDGVVEGPFNYGEIVRA